jgi:ribonuclease R
MSKKKKASHESRLFTNLFTVTEQFISGRNYSPMTHAQLMERLNFAPQHAHIIDEILEKLQVDGKLELSNGRYLYKDSTIEVVSGVLHVHPRGFAFLEADDPIKCPQDIFIPKQLTQNAVDGDKVEVVINTEVVSDKGPEGRVVKILSRSRTHLGGIVRYVESDGTAIAYAPILGLQQRVVVEKDKKTTMSIGDRIVMEVIDWGTKETETIGRISKYIGHISDPSCDNAAAIAEYELRSEFPPEAIAEAEAFGTKVSASDLKNREDLRDLECFTIDPDTAKDFDDALTLSKDKKGHYHLGVHIADVSHYVKPGSALDQEAKMRCNSTYFPAFCLPMLPGALSENLCSLKANVNRLTASVIMEFDPRGNLLNYRMTRAVIKSIKRFTYKEAKRVLDGELKSPHAATLKLMTELCYLLKKQRYNRGSIEFAMPDLVVIVDDKGVPQGTDYVAYDITHQLVEEFMLKANELVANHLSNLGKNLTYRVHDEPAEENLKDFALLVNSFGFDIPDKPSPQDLQKLFDEAMETPYGQYLATSYIRRMRLAIYSADNIGHYGLGLQHYCHFTSPIRRYVDLVVHRILFGDSDDRTQIEEIAHQCSNQERISAKAENSVVLLKKLRLLQKMHEKDPRQEYAAIISKVKGFGFFFEVLDLMLEGFVHVSEIDEDYFVYDEASMRLRGRHHGITYCAGDKVVVMLKSVDFVTLESEWFFVSKEQEEPKEPETPKKKKKSSKPATPKKEKKKKTDGTRSPPSKKRPRAK